MAEYAWYVGDLRTGKISRQVDLIDSTWMTSFDYAVPGTLEGSFPLRAVDPATGGPVWPTARADTAPGKAFLAVAYVDDLGKETFIEGGPIWTRNFDDPTGVLQVGGAGLSTFFDHRKPIPVGLGHAEDLLLPGTPVTLANVSAAIAKYAIGVGGTSLANAARYLAVLSVVVAGVPLVFPDDPIDLGDLSVDLTPTSDGDYLVVVHGYELPWTGNLLKQITERDGGPEIQFVPRRKATDPRFIEWVMHVGTPLLTQAGPPWQFDRTVPKSDVRDIDISHDGAGVAQRIWGAGEGEAEGRPIVFSDNADLIDIGWPLLEGEVTSTDAIADLNTLGLFSAERLAISSGPREAWKIAVSRDGRPNVGQLRPGDWSQVRVRDHEFQPDGDYAMRMLAMSGAGGSTDVAVTLSERLGD